MAHRRQNTGAITSASSGHAEWWFVVAVVFLPRLAMIWLGGPQSSGDSLIYTRVALNIGENLCVSLADPASGVCTPHWGGNQLPGYPFFLALAWWVSGGLWEAALYAQSLVFAVVVGVLADSLRKAGVNAATVWATVGVLAVSPSLIGWSRMLLTETLAAALVILLLAELIKGHVQGRPRVFSVAIVLAAGIFVRYDFALTVVPIGLAMLLLQPPIQAFRNCVVILLVCALPLSVWAVRGLAVGLPLTPPVGLTPKGQPLPSGMMKWIGTWLVDQRDLRSSVWAVVNYDYNDFRPPPAAYRDEREEQIVEGGIAALEEGYLGDPPPREIDNAFAELAWERVAAEPLKVWLGLPLRRMMNMWLQPTPSMGWPAEIDDDVRKQFRKDLRLQDYGGVLQTIRDHPGPVFVKAMIALHRYLLLLGALLVAADLWRRRHARPQDTAVFIGALALALAVVRTGAFSQTILVETRYLVPCLAWLDVAVVVYLADWWRRRHLG